MKRDAGVSTNDSEEECPLPSNQQRGKLGHSSHINIRYNNHIEIIHIAIKTPFHSMKIKKKYFKLSNQNYTLRCYFNSNVKAIK